MEEIRQEDEAERAAGFVSVLKLFSMRSLRWQVISIIVLMGGQQLSGVNAVRGRQGGGGREGGVPAGVAVPRALPQGPHQPLGTFQIYYYADQIYLSAGVNDHDVQYVTAGTGAVNVLMTVCAVSLGQPPRTEGILEGGVLAEERAGSELPLGLLISSLWLLLDDRQPVSREGQPMQPPPKMGTPAPDSGSFHCVKWLFPSM